MRKVVHFGLLVLAACAASPVEGTVTVSQALDANVYGTQVHHVLEATCGKTTCHGKLPRGLRVYGATALRLPNATGPTTPEEMQATLESIEGLEPEKLNAFLGAVPRSKDTAYHLLLLAKPLTLERHRGGVSLRMGEPAETCITSWLLGSVDATACAVQEAQE